MPKTVSWSFHERAAVRSRKDTTTVRTLFLAVLENALALTLAVVILALMAAAVAAGGMAALAEAATARLDRAGPQAVARR